VSLHQVNGAGPGTPVRVTVYRGAPIRLDGDLVHINAVDSPADRRNDARQIGRAMMFLGTFLGGGNLFIALAARSSNRRRPRSAEPASSGTSLTASPRPSSTKP
jgi:hypothetical protein